MVSLDTQEPGDVSKNISRTAIGNLAFPIAAFATAPILAWVLGAEGRGELAAATAPLMLLVSVAALGIPESVAYHTAAKILPVGRSLPRALALLWGAGVLAVGLTWVSAPALASQGKELTLLIIIAACALPFTLSVAAIRSVAIGLHDWRRVNIEKYVTAGVRLVAVSGMALFGNLTLSMAVIIMAYSPLAGALAYVSLKWGRNEQLPVISSRPTALMLKYSSHVWIGAMSGVLLMRMDQLLLLPLAGAVQLGMYAVAVNVAELLLVINNAVRDVMFSADAARRDDDRLHRAARVNLLVTIVFALPIGTTAPLWFPVIFGPDFTPALPVVGILIVATVLGVPGSVAGSALSARGRPGLRSKSLIIASLVNILAIILLVPAYGAVGAAYATVLGNLVSSNLNIHWLHKHFGVSAVAFYRVQKSDLLLIWVKIKQVLDRSK